MQQLIQAPTLAAVEIKALMSNRIQYLSSTNLFSHALILALVKLIFISQQIL